MFNSTLNIRNSIKTAFSSRLNTTSLIAAVLVLLAFRPYFTWGLSFSFEGISSVLIAVICLTNRKQQKYIGTSFLLASSYVILAIRGDYSFAGAVSVIMLAALFFLDSNILKRTYFYFNNIYSFLLVISFIVFILVVLLGISLPEYSIEALNQGKIGIVTYSCYPFLVVSETMADLLRYRFEAVFDEPGVVGTINAVCLLINGFDLKKWYNVSLLVTGLFTMSMAFFAICFIYVIVFAPVKYKITATVVASALIYMLQANEIFSAAVIDRILVRGDHTSLSNRNHMDDGWYEHFMQTPEYWTGLGNGANLIYNFGGCSYQNIIINNGFLFFLYYCFGFLMAVVKRSLSRYNIFIYLCVFVCIIYQRPFIENIAYMFLLYIPLVLYSESNTK